MVASQNRSYISKVEGVNQSMSELLIRTGTAKISPVYNHIYCPIKCMFMVLFSKSNCSIATSAADKNNKKATMIL